MPSKLFRPIANRPVTASAPMNGVSQAAYTQQSQGVQLPANFDKLKGIYAAMQNGSNGQALTQNLMQTAMANNSTLNTLVNAYNGDYKSAFYAMAQRKGIDPNQFASALQEALR